MTNDFLKKSKIKGTRWGEDLDHEFQGASVGTWRITMRAKRVRITDLQAKKQRRDKIVMLTAYDTAMARLLDGAGIDALLVGDSVGMVMLDHGNALPVTLDAMVHHTSAVSRGAGRALVVADMPFLTYQVTVPDAIRNAGRLLQEGGAAAVRVEGGRPIVDVVRRLVEIGIPVMGHLGVRPQSVHQRGGHARRGTEPREAEAIVADALALEEAGSSPSCSNRSQRNLHARSPSACRFPQSVSAQDHTAMARSWSIPTCSACVTRYLPSSNSMRS